jgi:hypothetical protein
MRNANLAVLVQRRKGVQTFVQDPDDFRRGCDRADLQVRRDDVVHCGLEHLGVPRCGAARTSAPNRMSRKRCLPWLVHVPDVEPLDSRDVSSGSQPCEGKYAVVREHQGITVLIE